MTKEALIFAGLAIAAAVLGGDHRGGEGLDGWAISEPEPEPDPDLKPKYRTKDKNQPAAIYPPIDESRAVLKRTLRIMKGDLDKLRHQLTGDQK